MKPASLAPTHTLGGAVPEYVVFAFQMLIGGKKISFRMPCNWKAVYEIFTEQSGKREIWDSARKARVLEDRKVQAIRTAWRIIHTWTKAQLVRSDN